MIIFPVCTLFPSKFTPFIFRCLYISLPLIFAPLDSNVRTTINFRPSYGSLIFWGSYPSKIESFKELMRFKMDTLMPEVINFCGINSAQCFNFFQIFQISVTNSLPLIFAPPIFGAQFAPFNFRPSPNFGAQFAPFNFRPPYPVLLLSFIYCHFFLDSKSKISTFGIFSK